MKYYEIALPASLTAMAAGCAPSPSLPHIPKDNHYHYADTPHWVIVNSDEGNKQVNYDMFSRCLGNRQSIRVTEHLNKDKVTIKHCIEVEVSDDGREVSHGYCRPLSLDENLIAITSSNLRSVTDKKFKGIYHPKEADGLRDNYETIRQKEDLKTWCKN